MIRIGIVGCGRILAAHLRGFRLLKSTGYDGFAITALCARQEVDALGYVQRGQGPPQRPAVSTIPGDPLSIGDEYISDFQDAATVDVFTDYRVMIEQGRIDAVMDLTSHGMHHLIAAKAFDHRKHLLSQKPLAATVRAARQMVEQARRAECVLGTFECFRFAPTTRALAWLFESGPGGALQMILHGYVGVWWAPDRIVANTPWRHRRAEAGGITLDLGVHFFDQMRILAGNPTSISGSVSCLEPIRYRKTDTGDVLESMECDADDTCFATIRFPGGALAQLVASWGGHGGPATMGTGSVFYGTKARVEGQSIVMDDGTASDVVTLFKREAPRELLDRAFPLGLDDWFATAQLDWLEAIRHGREPESSGEEGLADLAASYAILESDLAGRPVSFDEVLAGELREYQKPIDQSLGLG